MYSARPRWECPDGIKPGLVGHLEKKAEVSRSMSQGTGPGPHGANHRNATALDELASRITRCELNDHRLVTVWHSHVIRGGDRLSYLSGPEQDKVIARAGREVGGDNEFDVDDLFAELALAAEEDVIRFFQAELRAAVEARQKADNSLTKAAVFEKRAADAEAENETLRDRVAALEGELAHVTEQRNLLLSADTARIGKRRERVPDEPNIYVRAGKDGDPSYEVGYTEDGKQRWKTVGPDLEEARRVRDGLREEGKVRAPSEVAA